MTYICMCSQTVIALVKQVFLADLISTMVQDLRKQFPRELRLVAISSTCSALTETRPPRQ